MIENLLNKLRAFIVRALDKNIIFSRQTMVQIVEDEADRVAQKNGYWDPTVAWEVMFMFVERIAQEDHALTLYEWLWLKNTIWHALNQHNQSHMQPFDEEFIHYHNISREEMLLVLRAAAEELKADSFDQNRWGKARKNPYRLHWRVRLDVWLGWALNKVTFGLFYGRIARWFDNKYPFI